MLFRSVDTAFDEGQMKIGRKLATKLLNATKFVLTFDESAAGEPTSTLDQLMLERVAGVVAEATAAFEEFDYARALERTEALFWWFCDDYLELVKGRAYAGDPSAIGALRGPLHGGANEDVIKLLLKAGTADNALVMVKDMLANKIKVPGMGHRVYHTLDPRAISLKGMAEDLSKRTGHEELYKASTVIQNYVKETKNLNANVDFFSASMYYSLGIPVDLFTPVFAVSRMSGWTGHVMEQYENNRLIRPRVEYLGPEVGQQWVPINQR